MISFCLAIPCSERALRESAGATREYTNLPPGMALKEPDVNNPGADSLGWATPHTHSALKGLKSNMRYEETTKLFNKLA